MGKRLEWNKDGFNGIGWNSWAWSEQAKGSVTIIAYSPPKSEVGPAFLCCNKSV